MSSTTSSYLERWDRQSSVVHKPTKQIIPLDQPEFKRHCYTENHILRYKRNPVCTVPCRDPRLSTLPTRQNGNRPNLTDIAIWANSRAKTPMPPSDPHQGYRAKSFFRTTPIRSFPYGPLWAKITAMLGIWNRVRIIDHRSSHTVRFGGQSLSLGMMSHHTTPSRPTTMTPVPTPRCSLQNLEGGRVLFVVDRLKVARPLSLSLFERPCPCEVPPLEFPGVLAGVADDSSSDGEMVEKRTATLPCKRCMIELQISRQSFSCEYDRFCRVLAFISSQNSPTPDRFDRVLFFPYL